MKRDLLAQLKAWKASRRRKPLLLQGARQTGKTWLLNAFGREAYDGLAYFNFEEDPSLGRFFERDLKPGRILADLELHAGRRIRPARDLVFFDEIQASALALNALKYFSEQASTYHVAAAGSLVGVKLASPGSFPVGKVDFLDLHPMTFFEFLEALGEGRYRRHLEDLDTLEPLAEPFHEHLIDLLRAYYVVGGMPEAVQHYADSGDLRGARESQDRIVRSYMLDFAKHAPATQIPKLTLIWDSIPRHLAQENKKFVFSAIKTGARAREYEDALVWLEDAGLIRRACAVESSRHPLKHYADQRSFKVYALDVGLLGAMTKAPVQLFVQGARLFDEYKGALVENYVAQQLTATFQPDLYYWRSRGGKAELDFLLELGGAVLPLEVKAGLNPRSKSLSSFDRQYSPPLLARTNLLNLRRDGKTCNFPLYAVSLIPRLAGFAAGATS